jgi:hypothetical protein
MMRTSDFDWIYQTYREALLKADQVDVGSWHSQDVSGNPLLVTREVAWASFDYDVPVGTNNLQQEIQPNLPWAEQHFGERVGGDPVNPPPSHELWPWSHGQHQAEMTEEFSHTYPERMWPKMANVEGKTPQGRQIFVPHIGIRFEYGDLGDLVELLGKDRYTRQAYLPIFFPEDTGGSHRIRERIPCSLGYHFMVRKKDEHDVMDCMYSMRSCDFVRHFRDDIYMAARLLQWVALEASRIQNRRWDIMPGKLRVHIASLHIMEGDKYKLTEEMKSDGESS